MTPTVRKRARPVTRAPNRACSDVVVAELLRYIQSDEWVDVEGLHATLTDHDAWWASRRSRLTRCLLYLEHAYGAVEHTPITGLHVKVSLDGLANYIDGRNRNICGCGKCGVPGEHERPVL